MKISEAQESDLNALTSLDQHVQANVLKEKIDRKEILLSKEDGKIIGYLRYSYFWDEIPFMNLLIIDERYRNKGNGSELVLAWEQEMFTKGFQRVMTSSQSDETAQNFYRKLGYKDIGGFDYPDQEKELLFLKELDNISEQSQNR